MYWRHADLRFRRIQCHSVRVSRPQYRLVTLNKLWILTMLKYSVLINSYRLLQAPVFKPGMFRLIWRNYRYVTIHFSFCNTLYMSITTLWLFLAGEILEQASVLRTHDVIFLSILFRPSSFLDYFTSRYRVLFINYVIK